MNAVSPHPHDLARTREPRVGLFLSAAVRDGRATYAVRVRNISLHGAMIEGRTLPPFGADIYLERGTVSIPAKVSWACAGKCGLHFERAIDPRDWKVSLHSVEELPARANVVALRTTEGRTGEESAAAGDITARVAEELGTVRRQLGLCLDVISEYAPFLIRNGRMVQELEMSAQILGHLESLLTTEDPHAYLERLGMADLKRRLSR